MEIRKASREDSKQIARVYVDSWRTTYLDLVPDDYLDTLSSKETEKRWIDFLADEKESFIYVALNDEGKIIGFAAGESSGDKKFEGELYSLYLLQECRGLGVGRRLVSAIAKHFKENGFHSMMVWVMKQNASGLGFYKRMGGTEYLHRTSSFGRAEVEDVALRWDDLSVLCLE